MIYLIGKIVSVSWRFNGSELSVGSASSKFELKE